MMKTSRYIISSFSLVAILSSSCSDDQIGRTDNQNENSLEIKLQANIDQLNTSRADDSGFADDDKIGIYVVNYSGDQPGELLSEGNLATNVQFTFDEASNAWTGTRQLYFKDNSTKVDAYGIYPYQSNIADVTALSFSVERNQANNPDNAIGCYESSDLLWGKTSGASAENPLINVTFHHIMAGVQVTLMEGEGFDEGEWNSLDKSVYIAGTIRDASVDLRTGTVTPKGEYDGRYITANRDKENFRAIVIPQTVSTAQPLIMMEIGNESYEYTRAEDMIFTGSKLHKFTMKVSKNTSTGKYVFSLIQEAITAWESDLESHSGNIKEYIVVDVPEFGGLENAIRVAGLFPDKLINLKITGKLNAEDFRFMRENMVYLEALNINEVIVNGRICGNLWPSSDFEKSVWEKYDDKDYTLTYNAFEGMKYLKRVVLPAKLVAIGDRVFIDTSLTGNINLPEGLEYIGAYAFGLSYDETNRKSFSGELRLPSTLKYILNGAFYETDFSGELVFPAGIKYIGDNAFGRCVFIKSNLHLPESIEYIGSGAFFRVLGLSGELVYPQKETIVRNIVNDTKIDAVRLPEFPVEFSNGAFDGVPLRGDFKIPPSVKKLGSTALANTKLSHVYFPADLDIDIIPYALLTNNKSLIDTIAFPDNVEIISERALEGCDKLDAVIIPRKVKKIGGLAFAGCSSLTYIRCDAQIPPEVIEDVFAGINKDNFTLVVPPGSVNAYKDATGWKEFKRIAEYKNFVARPMKYNVLNKGGERTIILNADAEWEVKSIPEWCHLDKTSGNKKTELKLTIDGMEHNQGDRNGSIVFSLKGTQEYTCSVAIGQYDYEHDEDSYVTFQEASKGYGINLFIVGDGYDAIDISSGDMLAEMREEMEYMFAIEPYNTYRDYFNVYCGIALSDDSGIEDVNHWRNTKFHSVIANTDVRLETNYMDAMNYAADICSPLLQGQNPHVGVMMVVNSPIYEGICYHFGDSFCAVVTRSEYDYPNDARGIVQHEVGGHGFGWLGDEYVYHRSFIQNCPCICCHHEGDLKNDHARGFALNLSLHGKFRQVPWYHLITNPKYSDIVDVYEGGYFHGKGVFRSEYNSCMNNNVPYYSTWSRELIVKRIMALSGGTFNLQDFYDKDIRPESQIYGSPTRSGNALMPAMHGQPPVFIDNYKFGKKGGKK